MDLPAGRAGGRGRAAFRCLRTAGMAEARMVHAGVAAFPAVAEAARHGAPGSRISVERIGERGDSAPVAVDGGGERISAGDAKGRTVFVLGGAKKIPEADLYGADENRGGQGTGTRDLRQGKGRVSSDRAGDDRRDDGVTGQRCPTHWCAGCLFSTPAIRLMRQGCLKAG